jgi:hypothetical protein
MVGSSHQPSRPRAALRSPSDREQRTETAQAGRRGARPTAARTRPTSRRGFAAPSPSPNLRLSCAAAITRLLDKGVRWSEPGQGSRPAPVRIVDSYYSGAGQYQIARKEGEDVRRPVSGGQLAYACIARRKPPWKLGSLGSRTQSHRGRRPSGAYFGMRSKHSRCKARVLNTHPHSDFPCSHQPAAYFELPWALCDKNVLLMFSQDVTRVT